MQIVAALSERKLDAQGQKRPWEQRKQEALDHLQQASLAAVAVKAADALHNARCTALDARREGPAVWGRFARGPALMLENYRRMLHLVQERIQAHPLAVELAEAVEDLARAMAELAERPAP
jgi:(p)ppGpp synthase/HD superfamily hydrolase